MRIELDVSALPPCEPMERILQALRELRPGDWLRVYHRQQPYPLYNLLRQGGYAWRETPAEKAGFEILIWRDGDAAAHDGALN